MKKIIAILIVMGWMSSFPGSYYILPGMREAYADGWYNTSWSSRKKITIDNTKVTADLTDFPVLISLTSDTGLAADAQDDGDDILFTLSDGTTKLSHEIEKFDGATGELVAWVKVPSLANSTDTVLYMYYKNSSATSQQDATNVWDSNYKGVWHLKESGNGTANEFADSTSNANHGLGGGGTAANVPTKTSVQIGDGQDFDGTNDFIQIADAASLDIAGEGTIEVWIRRDASGSWHSMVAKGNTSTDAAHNYTFEIEDTAGGNQLSGGLGNGTSGELLGATTVITTGTFRHAVFTWPGTNGGTKRIYVNGTQDTTGSETVVPAGNTSPLFFGRWGANTDLYNGIIDEVRISNVARASTWIQTEYNNQSSPSTFYTLGTAESLTVTPPEPPPSVTLTINSTSPANGAASVAVNTSVSATFSMLMNGSTLSTSTFKLSGGGVDISGVVTTNGATATFTPSSNLDYNTIYTAQVTTKAQAANFAGTSLDNDFTWSFTTTEDADPPIVSSTTPVNGAAEVDVSSTIIATFSETMWSSTINTNTFTVSDGSGNIVGTVSYSGTTATFTPSGNLSDSTTYTARITTGVMDLTGNAMTSDYTWSFTTVDTTQPLVISTSPVKGATGVAINSGITATFSETMQSSTINTNTFTVSDGSGNIAGTVSYSGATATFTPLGSLSDSTTYTATIITGVKDLAGNAMASDYTWSFTTVDTTQPIVSSTSPVNGGTGMAINSTITATFNEVMQPSTINTNTFTVSDGSGNISGKVSYSGKAATFTPSSNLSHFTTYKAMITTGVKDLAGNAMASAYTWSFTTTTDADPPTVNSTNPANGVAGVNVNSNITATFSEAMQSSTITTNTFTVNDGSGNISGTVSYSGTTATFTPASNLSDSTTYTARITTGVKDLAGNSMASPYTWSFATTAGGADITSPTVNSTIPVNGAAEVDVSSIIIATFSEAMQSSTINTNTFTVSDGSGNIGGTVSYSGVTATFTPSANLDFNTIYTATITTMAMDSAGNAMVADYTWSFTTISALPTPTITPTPTATGTPTPTPCEPESISVSPVSPLKLQKQTSDTVTVTVIGEDDCAVEGETVTATINKAGEKRISISPTSAITDDDGQTEFTITALKKTGSARAKFKSGNVTTILKVKVVK